ncbi:caspase family protein [Sphingobacterium corticibacterium]|uniref:Caspase family protein n=1 Tax=Sphingobacterium corticibacterium TaxID=2484746 RepID=A0A4V2DBI7_9SPHI|nr:caspase family protein [Sphingobacterium corticibacterium]RZF58128.1 caspase family protein [Sphingobacterium corticibacterium]
MKKLLFILTILLSLQSYAIEKHALIIAIGNYPTTETGWSAISSVNDVPLIKQTLLSQGFPEVNIATLKDAQATKAGIIDALNTLQRKIKQGDIVVIHYSGHGQQVFDDNGDEIDGLDESLVPYDAHVEYSSSYKGEKHIRDDELGDIIASFRNKLGSDGQLLFILDSCHSGSMTRSSLSGIARGGRGALTPPDWEAPKEINQIQSGSGLGIVERAAVHEHAAPFVMISGASANELNYEYNGVGSLSYAFSTAMNELGTDFTYRQLFSAVTANLNAIRPQQTPTIEGDMDMKLFKGEYAKQQPYFEVTDMFRNNGIININGGLVNHIFDQATVFVVPAGTRELDTTKVLTRGTVTSAKFNEAVVVLDQVLKDNNTKNYWVFLDKPSYGDIAVTVFFDKSVTEQSVLEGLESYLEDNMLGNVVKDSLYADIIVYKTSDGYAIGHGDGAEPFADIRPSTDQTLLSGLTSKIFNYAQGSYLKKLNVKNNNYEFAFKLVPVEFDPKSRRILGQKEEELHRGGSGIFQVAPKVDHVVLQITNKSKKDLYISIVEINTAGEITPFFPNQRCNLHDDERKLAPGQTVVFRDCVYSFGLPYERLILKGFASEKPLNFQPTVKTRGVDSASNNPLEKFLQSSYAQTRGSEAESVTGDLDGYSTEFVYDIVKK